MSIMTQGSGPYRSPGVPGGWGSAGISGPTGPVGGQGGSWGLIGATGARGVTGPAGPVTPTEVIGSQEIPFMLGFRLVYIKHGSVFAIGLSFMDSREFQSVHRYESNMVLNPLVPSHVESTIPEELQGVITPAQSLCYSTCIAYYITVTGNNAQPKVKEFVPDLYQKVRDQGLWEEVLLEAPKIFEVGQVMLT